MLHPDFPLSPHVILDPQVRWLPTDASGNKKRMPPLVRELRFQVKKWRDNGYAGAAETSKALLEWWFEKEHLMPSANGLMVHFQYYFAQREAVETIIYLHDVVKFQDKYDLLLVVKWQREAAKPR